MKIKYILILMLLISFGSIGAVAFTPGLPMIAEFFSIDSGKAGQTVTWYLIGYTIGQLIYGPLANRFGSRNTLIISAGIEIIGASLCVLSKYIPSFELLIFSRFLMALGAGGGLTMAYTIASKLCEAHEMAKVISLLSIAFAITPGLGVFIGGVLVTHFGWVSSFYFMLIYGLVLLLLSKILPEVFVLKDINALNPKRLWHNYTGQFKRQVLFGGLLLGTVTSIVYTFAALAPFVAMDAIGISPETYGTYNFIPVVGMIIGSLLVSYLCKIYKPEALIKTGLVVCILGSGLMTLCLLIFTHRAMSLFAPLFVIYIGTAFIIGNCAALALRTSDDKSNASSLMSFINMGCAVTSIMLLTVFSFHSAVTLPLLFLVYSALGVVWFYLL